LTRLVVDVSVGVKWFLLGDEPLKDRAPRAIAEGRPAFMLVSLHAR